MSNGAPRSAGSSALAVRSGWTPLRMSTTSSTPAPPIVICVIAARQLAAPPAGGRTGGHLRRDPPRCHGHPFAGGIRILPPGVPRTRCRPFCRGSPLPGGRLNCTPGNIFPLI